MRQDCSAYAEEPLRTAGLLEAMSHVRAAGKHFSNQKLQMQNGDTGSPHRGHRILFRAVVSALPAAPTFGCSVASLTRCAGVLVIMRQDCSAYAEEPLRTVGLLEAMSHVRAAGKHFSNHRRPYKN